MDNDDSRLMTIKQVAQLALDVQDAVNLSGVVRSFSEVVKTVWDEAHRMKRGTDWVNEHPICILFVDKLADLTGAIHEHPTFSDAYDACKAIAEGRASCIVCEKNEKCEGFNFCPYLKNKGK